MPSLLESKSIIDLNLHRQIFLLAQPVVEKLQQLRHIPLVEYLELCQRLLLAEFTLRLQQEHIHVVHNLLNRLFFHLVQVGAIVGHAPCHHHRK